VFKKIQPHSLLRTAEVVRLCYRS